MFDGGRRRDGLRSTAVVAEGVDRATRQSLAAERLWLRRFGLRVNVGMTAVIPPREMGRRRLPAQVAVDGSSTSNGPGAFWTY